MVRRFGGGSRPNSLSARIKSSAPGYRTNRLHPGRLALYARLWRMPASSPPRLRVVHLRSRLAGPFDLDLPAGSCTVITGSSGAGKSLLLRMIADLDPNHGEVFLDGKERRSFTAPAWRRSVLYSAAEPGWWFDSVAPHFPGPTLDTARRLAPELGLSPDLLQGSVIRLSTGERQRLALIRAMALEPPVLLFDEPTGALDQDSTKRVEALLRERLAAGTAMLLVSHSPEQAVRLGDQHFRMEARRLVRA